MKQERVPEFTDWLHDQLIAAINAAAEAEAIDISNNYEEFEETIDRIETRGAKDAIRNIWERWQLHRYENEERK